LSYEAQPFVSLGGVYSSRGLFFALMGVVPGLYLAGLMLTISRILLGAEFAVQETLLMRLVPDNLRGRVSTTDRAAEMLIWCFFDRSCWLVAQFNNSADSGDREWTSLRSCWNWLADCFLQRRR
jgi:hypothetical protein